MKTRKKRSLKRKEWSGLRAEISKIVDKLNILPTDFRPLKTTENWEAIQEKIVTTFCHLSSPTERPLWLWTKFKQETHLLKNVDRPEKYLEKLIDADEIVWYVISETVNEKDKFWFYEGKIKTITTIIDETWCDEMYVVSKKYDWLVCINHHDDLIATGNIMPEKFKTLEDLSN